MLFFGGWVAIFGRRFGRSEFFFYFCTTKIEVRLILTGDLVAQPVEHNTFNVGVLGSSPSEFTQTTTFSGGCFVLLCFVLCSIIEHWLECL